MRQKIQRLLFANMLIIATGWMLYEYGIPPINNHYVNLNKNEATLSTLILLALIFIISRPLALIIVMICNTVFPDKSRT